MTVVRLKQRDLLTRRWRSVEAPDPSELTIHIALVARLRHELRDDVVFLHAANGEYRDKRTAAKLRAMGVLPGVSDLIFDDGDQVLYLELKTPRGALSEAQQRFKTRVEMMGRHYVVARSVNEAMTILYQHGMTK